MSNVYLRPAEWSDVDLLYEWANDKQVRSNPFNTEIISCYDHKHWFENYMADENTVIYMLCDTESKIGQIRLDCSEHIAKINYIISKRYRGLGYGEIIIRLVEKKIVIDKSDIRCIKAIVRSNNVASQKVFEDNGYTGTYDENEKHYLYFKELTPINSGITIDCKNPSGGVLLLTNNRNSLTLYDALKETGEDITIYSDSIDDELLAIESPKYVISYNYTHIIQKRLIDYMCGKMLNIHISMLPWNRGSDPNFWSFIDNTPKGVTIHLIDEGLDTGDILCQKELTFNEDNETFRTSYNALNDAAVSLLLEHWNEIVNGVITPISQPTGGSYHNRRDFHKYIIGKKFNWDMVISEFKREC
ncbi:MAG: GNAT family N-acetyltransferase [Syntrophales bacterium]|nr:GNAT family N-acetyltransferase [Syntrophales bacterium]